MPNNVEYTAPNTVAVAVDEGDDIKCTITNTRKQGKIELAKDWVGTAGNVDLFIKKAGVTVPGGQAAANGQDGSTGEVTVDTGSFTGERGVHRWHAGRRLRLEAHLRRRGQGHSAWSPNNADYTAPGTVAVAVDEGDDIKCTITTPGRRAL